MKATHKKIVILGGGFAGVYSALAVLRNTSPEAVEITIINKTNYFLFTPMLHEVATGGLGHHQVVESIRGIIYKTPIKFLEAEVRSIDIAKKEIVTTRGRTAYDIVVVALGATTNFYDTPGAASHTFVLKNLSDAITLRDQVIKNFEAASREKKREARKKFLSFVVVGGGATGVELAAELAEFARKTLHVYYRKEFSPDDVRITLVQNGIELIPSFSEATRARSLKVLAEKGVTVRLNEKVSSISAGGVTLGTGEIIGSKTVVWTAGVKPNSIEVEGGHFMIDAGGRIETDTTLRVSGTQDVFALGDIAKVISAETGKPYPMLAQVAVAQAQHLGKNIARMLAGEELEPFAYNLKGELVSLGHWEAAGTIVGVDVYGKFAWFVWRTVYLFKFISTSKKMKIAVDWTVHLFFPRDASSA